MKLQICVLSAVFYYAAADFRQAALKSHNDFRSDHHVGPLVLDNKLNNQAQKWASKLAKLDQLKHSQPGENLYYRKPTSGSKEKDVEAAVQAWYDEIKDYRFNRPGFDYKTGHFTQVVWKGSHKMGVGYAVSRSKSVYVVAQYHPPGNFVGEFEQNVLAA